MTVYRHAPEVAEVATEIIPKWHEHLLGVPIEYVFREKAAKKGGRAVPGTARKITGVAAYLLASNPAGSEFVDAAALTRFVVEVAYDVWFPLTDEQRVALVDHLLCFLQVTVDDETGDVSFGTRACDVQEFTEVVERHGAWSNELESFAAPLRQLAFNM